MESPDRDVYKWRGFLYVILMFVFVIVFDVLVNQNYFHMILTIGMRVRTAVTAAIYRKVITDDIYLYIVNVTIMFIYTVYSRPSLTLPFEKYSCFLCLYLYSGSKVIEYDQEDYNSWGNSQSHVSGRSEDTSNSHNYS